MNPDDTETSSDQPENYVLVPGDYGGILDPHVVSDENNNVTELPDKEIAEAVKATSGYDDRWERQRRRDEAMSMFVRLLEYLPMEVRPHSVEDALVEVEKIERYLTVSDLPVE